MQKLRRLQLSRERPKERKKAETDAKKAANTKRKAEVAALKDQNKAIERSANGLSADAKRFASELLEEETSNEIRCKECKATMLACSSSTSWQTCFKSKCSNWFCNNCLIASGYDKLEDFTCKYCL